MFNRKLILPILIVIVIVLLSSQFLTASWNKNIVALATMRSLLTNDSTELHESEQALSSLRQDRNCRKDWFQGLVYNALGDPVSRDQFWKNAICCSKSYTPLVRAEEPEDFKLAEFAVKTQPEQAEAWFWLAEIQATNAPEQAIDAYWQGLKRQPHDENAWIQLGNLMAALDTQVALRKYEQLEIDQLASKNPADQSEAKFILARILSKSQPDQAILLYRDGLQLNADNGVRWYELGDLLVKSNSQAAIEAYLQSCYYGDPGNHGCFGAGKVAEEQGDILSAIRYYRLSKWDIASQRANQLEQSLP
jgi:hypothetical protein